MDCWHTKDNSEGGSEVPISQDSFFSQDTLTATQEFVTRDTDISETEEIYTNQVWGTLIPIVEKLDVVELRGETFRVGRNPRRCHVLLASHHLPCETPANQNVQINCVSREQFQIFRGKDIFGVEDLSRNGTFVNGIRVGENNKQMLKDGDTIGILEEDFVLYVFISEQGPRRKFGSKLCDLYHMGNMVGTGSTCCVYEAWGRRDYLKVAVKVINKLKWPSKYSAPTDLLKEVDILKNLDHPGITKVLNVIETSWAVNIVMEFAEGGELFDMIFDNLEDRNMNESVAKFQFYQICKTIDYLHSMNICHRDLKLENLLLVSQDRRSKIKVSDFGLAKVSNETSVLETYVGTPVYMAPEVINAEETGECYSLLSDCWSLGVILYTLLSGTQPFRSHYPERILHKKILSGSFCKMEGSKWEHVTDEAKNLVSSLLVVNPKDRLNTSQILQHKWFTNDTQLCQEAKNVLFEAVSNADSGRGLSARKITTNLEVFMQKKLADEAVQKDSVKKRVLSFNESEQKNNYPKKRICIEDGQDRVLPWTEY